MANQFDPNLVSNFPNCPNGLLSFNQFEIMNNTNIQWDIFKRYQQNSNQFFTYNAFNNKLDIINSRPIIDLKTWMIDLPDIDIYIGDLFNYTTWLISDTDLSNFSANFAFITSILASLCGRIRIKMGEWIEPANLHTFIIAESGYRKSVLIDRATNIFLEYEDKYNQNYDQNESRFKKNIIKDFDKELRIQAKKALLSNNNGSLDKILSKHKQIISNSTLSDFDAKQIKLLCSSSTNFGIIRDICDNGGNMFICSSESDGIEELISKDTLELLIKGYGQEAYSRSSGNKSFYIPKVNINILVAAQPTFITKIISSEKLLSKGLPARWIILLNESIHTTFIPDNIMEIKKNFYYSINKFIKMFYTHSVNSKKFDVEVSQEGYSILSEFQEELKNNALDQSLKSWIAKLPGKAVRIALALHAWRHKDKLLQHHINKEDMKYAVYLAKVALSHAKFIFSPNGYLAQVNAIKIYESLLRITSDTERISLLRQGINSTELAQRTKLRKNEIIPALQFLESCNLIATWDDGGSKIHVVPRYDFFQNICV